MKHCILTIAFLAMMVCGFSQNPYVIETKIVNEFCPSDKKFAEFEKLSKIKRSMYDESWNQIKTEDELSDEDRLFIQKMNNQYDSLEESELYMSPWQILGDGCSWYCGAMYDMKASSTLASQGKNEYTVKNLWDDDVRTAWVEGKNGYGIGEYITFDFEKGSARATRCTLVNGYSKNQKTWKDNSRVKTLNMYEDDKLIATIKLKDTRCAQTFELKNHRRDKRAMRLKFVITEVYKGDKYDDTAISELIFDGEDVHCLGKGTLITMADGSMKKIEEITIGDNVVSYNMQTKEMENNIVKHVCTVNHSDMINILLSSGKNIVTTTDHPFLSEKGWVSYSPEKTKQYNRYKQTEVMRLSNCKTLLFYENGTVRSESIQKVEFINDFQPTYTLELEQDGGFVANGFIVGQE